MKLQNLLEMPQHFPRELEDEPDVMTPFFITDERLAEWYDVLAEHDKVVAAITKDHESAMIGLRTTRHDGKSGILIYGDLQFKGSLSIGANAAELGLNLPHIRQVSLVTVVKESKFKGLGSFLYSSLVQHGFTVISDTKQYDGGKELWLKLGRSHLPNEAVYIMNHGKILTDSAGKPIEYDGANIPVNEIWSSDQTLMHVLLVYTKKR